MSHKIGVTWVSPCCGRRLGISNVDEIIIVKPYTNNTAIEYWTTNAMCCSELGDGMYKSQSEAEADLERIKEITILASIRWSWEQLHQQHEREMEEMTDAVEDFKYFNSEQYNIDSAGPQRHEWIKGNYYAHAEK